MGIEEQREEREVLDSIFPDEITDAPDRENTIRISIKLDVVDQSGDDEDALDPSIILQVAYPEEYPDVFPDLDILPDPNGARHPLLDLSTDKAGLLESLQSTLEESLGMSMVFSIHATLKENAERLITDRIAEQEAKKEAEAAEKEAKEDEKFHGTPVTRETFLEWHEKFKKEIAEQEEREAEEKEAEEKKKRGGKLEEKKLTGRQLWERGLAGKGDEDDIDGEDALTSGVAKMEVSG